MVFPDKGLKRAEVLIIYPAFPFHFNSYFPTA